MEKTQHDSALSLGLIAFLSLCGLPQNRPVKLYRHSDHKHRVAKDFPSPSDNKFFNIEKVYRDGLIDPFQGAQGSKNFGNDLVAFFIGEESGATRFIGLYEVTAIGDHKFKSANAQKARELNFLIKGDVWHELTYQPQYKVLENRLIIDWPKQRTSHRWLVDHSATIKDMTVLELRAPNSFQPFPGFNQVLLSFIDLETHSIHAKTSPWVKVLLETRGVYLITDLENGQLYVGSATGENGLWGRWSNYTKTKHGGNKLMIEGLDNISLNVENLQFSVLETLSNRATEQDGIAAEIRWKKMLGKRATTLNGN